MTNRLEVESAIKQLPESEVRALANWLQDYLDEMWDRQIEADLASGKLDRLIAQAEEDMATNNVRYLDEVLRNVWILESSYWTVTWDARAGAESLSTLAAKLTSPIVAFQKGW